MPEVLGAVGQVAAGAVRAAVPAIAKAPVAAIAPVAQAAAPTAAITREIGAGLGAVKELAPASVVPKLVKTTPFIAKVDMIAKSGDSHKALSMLAFGTVKNGFIENVASRLPESVLQHDFITLEKLGPEGIKGISAEIGKMDIPQHALDDPIFAQQFYDAFQQEVMQRGYAEKRVIEKWHADARRIFIWKRANASG